MIIHQTLDIIKKSHSDEGNIRRGGSWAWILELGSFSHILGLEFVFFFGFLTFLVVIDVYGLLFSLGCRVDFSHF